MPELKIAEWLWKRRSTGRALLTSLLRASARGAALVTVLVWVASAQAARDGDPDRLGPGSPLPWQDCLTSLDSYLRVASPTPRDRLACRLALDDEDMQLKLSYDRPGWPGSELGDSNAQFGHASDQNALSTYLHAGPAASVVPFASDDMEARLALEGKADRLKYSAEYGLFRAASATGWNASRQDRSGGRVQAEWQLGLLKPQFELSRFQTSLQDDPTGSREVTSSGKLSVDLRLPQWPILSIAYGRDLRELPSRDPSGTTQEISTDAVSGTLWYGRSSWDAYVTSSYFSIREDSEQASKSVGYHHFVSASYRPIDTLTISPNLAFSRTSRGPDDYWYATRSASLGIYLSSARPALTLSLYGAYLESDDSSRTVDTKSLDVSLGLTKDLGRILRLPHRKQTLTLELNYNRYTDAIYRGASTQSVSALLLVKILR